MYNPYPVEIGYELPLYPTSRYHQIIIKGFLPGASKHGRGFAVLARISFTPERASCRLHVRLEDHGTHQNAGRCIFREPLTVIMEMQDQLRSHVPALARFELGTLKATNEILVGPADL